MRTVRRIFRNTALILGADTLRLLIAFALTPVIARGLGSGGLGVYAYVMSLVSILGVVTDFGLSPYYIRTAQRHDYPPPGSATLGLRLAISLTAAAALALYAWRWAEATLRVPLLLGSLILVLGVLPAHVTALLRARERMTFDAVVRISGAVITTGGGIVAILRGWGVPGVMGALVVGGALLTALAWRTFRREEPTLTLGAPAQVYREILRGAWPFAALAILGVVYFRIDAVMLFTMRGRDTAGQYAAAYRLMEAALLVPLTLAGAAFPAMARY
ncbi:MAG TPA: oligosaccharide flippase family protein, partial [bacterium]|nr:oligosaccharide flippase family protein [bacterium]